MALQTFKKIPIWGVSSTPPHILIPSGYAQVRYRAQYDITTAMNRIVTVIVPGNTVGEAIAAAGRLEQNLAANETDNHLPYLTCIDITAVSDLAEVIDEESGGLVLSEVTL